MRREQTSGSRLTTSPVTAGLALLVGVLFVLLSHLRLWHTDLWGHLAYGRVIWQRGGIPATEPLMPFAHGVPLVDSAWLSQLGLFGVHSAAGVAGLQTLYAVGATACAVLLLAGCYRRTQHVVWALAGCGLFLWVDWQQLKIMRPQLAGLVAYVWLLTVLDSRTWRRRNWLLVPAVMMLWANLHGSFPVGLALIGCYSAGRAVDVLRRAGKPAAVFRDRRLCRGIALLALSAVAVSINPYGPALYAGVYRISQNPNVADLVEWQPLRWSMQQTQAALAAVVLLAAAIAATRRRISAAHIVPLVVFGAAAVWRSRFLVWWAPLAGYLLSIYGHAAWQRIRRTRAAASAAGRSPGWTLASATVLTAAFLGSSLGQTFWRNGGGDLHRRLTPDTPVDATEYLNSVAPTGQMFNTYEWGDYLLWAGPTDARVFLASHAHLVPRDVWQSYLRITRLRRGWQQSLADYRVETIVIDKLRQKPLASALRRSRQWRIGYEDRLAVVFHRSQSDNLTP